MNAAPTSLPIPAGPGSVSGAPNLPAVLGVGVGLALLFTPTSGADLRNRIRDGATEVVDSFRESYRRAVDSAEDEEFMGV